MQLTQDGQEMGKSVSKPTGKAVLAASNGSGADASGKSDMGIPISQADLADLQSLAIYLHCKAVSCRDERLHPEDQYFGWAKLCSRIFDALDKLQKLPAPNPDEKLDVSNCDVCGGPMPVPYTDERGAETVCAECAGVEIPKPPNDQAERRRERGVE